MFESILWNKMKKKSRNHLDNSSKACARFLGGVTKPKKQETRTENAKKTYAKLPAKKTLKKRTKSPHNWKRPRTDYQNWNLMIDPNVDVSGVDLNAYAKEMETNFINTYGKTLDLSNFKINVVPYDKNPVQKYKTTNNITITTRDRTDDPLRATGGYSGVNFYIMKDPWGNAKLPSYYTRDSGTLYHEMAHNTDATTDMGEIPKHYMDDAATARSKLWYKDPTKPANFANETNYKKYLNYKYPLTTKYANVTFLDNGFALNPHKFMGGGEEETKQALITDRFQRALGESGDYITSLYPQFKYTGSDSQAGTYWKDTNAWRGYRPDGTAYPDKTSPAGWATDAVREARMQGKKLSEITVPDSAVNTDMLWEKSDYQFALDRARSKDSVVSQNIAKNNRRMAAALNPDGSGNAPQGYVENYDYVDPVLKQKYDAFNAQFYNSNAPMGPPVETIPTKRTIRVKGSPTPIDVTGKTDEEIRQIVVKNTQPWRGISAENIPQPITLEQRVEAHKQLAIDKAAGKTQIGPNDLNLDGMNQEQANAEFAKMEAHNIAVHPANFRKTDPTAKTLAQVQSEEIAKMRATQNSGVDYRKIYGRKQAYKKRAVVKRRK